MEQYFHSVELNADMCCGCTNCLKRCSTEAIRVHDGKAQILSELVAKVWDKVASGEVRPTIYRVMPIEQANEAHALLRDGVSAGKVVLTL